MSRGLRRQQAHHTTRPIGLLAAVRPTPLHVVCTLSSAAPVGYMTPVCLSGEKTMRRRTQRQRQCQMSSHVVPGRTRSSIITLVASIAVAVLLDLRYGLDGGIQAALTTLLPWQSLYNESQCFRGSSAKPILEISGSPPRSGPSSPTQSVLLTQTTTLAEDASALSRWIV